MPPIFCFQLCQLSLDVIDCALKLCIPSTVSGYDHFIQLRFNVFTHDLLVFLRHSMPVCSSCRNSLVTECLHVLEQFSQAASE